MHIGLVSQIYFFVTNTHSHWQSWHLCYFLFFVRTGLTTGGTFVSGCTSTCLSRTVSLFASAFQQELVANVTWRRGTKNGRARVLSAGEILVAVGNIGVLMQSAAEVSWVANPALKILPLLMELEEERKTFFSLDLNPRKYPNASIKAHHNKSKFIGPVYGPHFKIKLLVDPKILPTDYLLFIHDGVQKYVHVDRICI